MPRKRKPSPPPLSVGVDVGGSKILAGVLGAALYAREAPGRRV